MKSKVSAPPLHQVPVLQQRGRAVGLDHEPSQSSGTFTCTLVWDQPSLLCWPSWMCFCCRTMTRVLQCCAATPPLTSPSRSSERCRSSPSEETRATAACCRPIRRWLESNSLSCFSDMLSKLSQVKCTNSSSVLCLPPAEETTRPENSLHVLCKYSVLPLVSLVSL